MNQPKKLSEIGEFGFIEQIRRVTKIDNSIIKGIGDDAAVIKYSKDKYLLVTCDMIIEGVHFLRRMRPEDIGYKALACNISDIAAMGGIPRYAVISVGLPRDLTIDYAKNIYKGINELAKVFHINIVGGDTNRSDKIIINITLLGEVEKNNLILRSNAKAGDWIFVSGNLGGANFSKAVDFKPRFKESQFLVRHYKLHSMIDISDGLVSDLSHILESSKKGAVLYKELIPKSKGASMLDALYKGEDYELLFTLPRKEAVRLINDSRHKNNLAFFSFIGIITNKKSRIEFVDSNYRRKVLIPKGYRHF